MMTGHDRVTRHGDDTREDLRDSVLQDCVTSSTITRSAGFGTAGVLSCELRWLRYETRQVPASSVDRTAKCLVLEWKKHSWHRTCHSEAPPASCQAAKPPIRLETAVKPWSRKKAVALALELPW